MLRFGRIPAVFLLTAVLAVSTSAQERPLLGTVIDIDEGRGRLQIESDSEDATRLTIEVDSIATTWHGFGTMIAGKPEIFKGSSGLANLRLGDRIELRGTRPAEGIYRAAQVTLLGREVPAPQVGVGQTRTPTSVSTPTEEQARAASIATIEGTIRQVNANDGRIVLQTADRRMVTVTGFRSTPVWYQGEEYRIANLEVGDWIRVDIDPADVRASELVARRIEVTRSVQESGTSPDGARVTTIRGTIARTDPGLDYTYVNDGRGEVRVDMSRAEDANGDVIRSRDLRVGDRVEITGNYNRVGDLFLASTLRFSGVADGRDSGGEVLRYGVVTLTGTVVETLEDGATLAIRERDGNELLRVWAVRELVVRLRGDGFTSAAMLRVNDIVVVEAFRDQYGTLIAQTIRLRNR